MDRGWFEVWAYDAYDVPYVLVLISRDGMFRIFDPREGNKICFESADYETARFWLLEDEFEFIGRSHADPDA